MVLKILFQDPYNKVPSSLKLRTFYIDFHCHSFKILTNFLQLHAIPIRIDVALAMLSRLLDVQLLAGHNASHKALVRVDVATLRVRVRQPLLLPLAQTPILTLLVHLTDGAATTCSLGRPTIGHLIVHRLRRPTIRGQLRAQPRGVRNLSGELAVHRARRHQQIVVQACLRQPTRVVKVQVVADVHRGVGGGARTDLELKDVGAALGRPDAAIGFFAAVFDEKEINKSFFFKRSLQGQS